ncbi:hypothetical protein [Desnuesiella massiliensis]|uniref:hypothetical protein n=1 Tax=Desnuesiella massiliensis TaxID=1650662 RepID=UPI0006E1BFC5|nr:hypothetical protein [Desnuesiella massiliensis]
MIYTLDARDNIILKLIASISKSNKEIYDTIKYSLEEMKIILANKNISYDDLKNTLIPRNDRLEMLVLFNTQHIERADYGYYLFDRIIPRLNVELNCSILSGDLINIGIPSYKLVELIESSIEDDSFPYYPEYMYLAYFNNLSKNQYNTLKENLSEMDEYVTAADMTYSSVFKDYLSFIIGTTCIKFNNYIILKHEDDRDPYDNCNLRGYPFGKHGYIERSIPELYYNMFLSYKIERSYIGADIEDINFSINAIKYDFENIELFDILIEEPKLKYLKENKTGVLKKLDLLEISKSDFQKLIKQKIMSNYFYNLAYDEEHNTTKFNISIEIINKDYKKNKALCSFEYISESKTLRLITFY